MVEIKYKNMVEIKYKKFTSKDSLELEFFKELDFKIENIDEEIKDGLELILKEKGYSSNILKLVKIINVIDGKVIGFMEKHYGRDYFIFDKVLNLNVGDLININDGLDNEASIFKIDDKVLNKEFLDKCNKDLGEESISIEYFKKDILKREDIEKKIKYILKKTKEEKEAKKKEIIKEDDSQRKSESEYNKTGIFEFKKIGVKVNKKVIDTDNTQYILKNNVNNILEFHNFNEGRCYGGDIRDVLINKRESFTFKKNNNKIYSIEFENNSKKKILQSFNNGNDTNFTKINGVRIRKNKINFILERINKNTSKEEIKLLSKLTGMKSDLLDLEKVKLKGIEIDIKFSIINENNFNVEMFGRKEKFDWDKIKDHFFDSGKSRSVSHWFDVPNFMDFTKEFGLSKQDTYDYLKRVVIINNLNEENKK